MIRYIQIIVQPSVGNMASVMVKWFVLIAYISESLAGLNVLNAISNISTGPLEKLATDPKDFIQTCSENGFDAEKHDGTTDDGYILSIFRIPPGKNCTKKTPLLLVHGLLQSSDCFADSGAEAPAFVLARECYDVWLGNVRGNTYSRRHVSLDPDRDLRFWKFSIDEMGMFDIPAMVDYVLDATDTNKLIYIGFSQGGSSFFIMNSEKPEYADKISLFIGLAPASRQYYSKSVLFRSGTAAANALETPLESAGVWEILANGFPIQGSLSTLCQVELLAAVVCGTALSVLDSPHPGSLTPETVRRIIEHAPAGTSVQNLARYGQSLKELKFVKFDYGYQHNLELYGSAEPPEYDLGASMMPAVVFHGKADHIVDTRDVQWAVNQLPNLLEFVMVEDPQWNHVDMSYNRYWKDTIFAPMEKYLKRYDGIY